ncbi:MULTISPECIES: SpoIIE family protein phosphatase [Streptomyces]|uniref:SpoIIE family protein phosphatase n=1 Tax=Streptomyces TaxID=1883 RepID=UPI00196475EF|nr:MULTISPECIES: SpoIIE family protein phosphatase [Streptomyces]QRX90762.1 SpoIIE family protein phosphatase [Streptomyces noursei]UJB40682.1 SpoIIE family protein phosphatase [Streptomyces sp. A1-5]
MNAWNAATSADFRGPLDVTRAATAVLDARGLVIGWSAAARKLLGYTPEEIIGRPIGTFLPDAADATAAAGTAQPSPAAMVNIETRTARHADGHRLAVAITMCPLADTLPAAPRGPARVMVATALDDLRYWESRQAMLHGLATQSPVGLAIYDEALRLTWFNTSYGREIGLPLRQLIGKRADELYPGEFVTEGYPHTLHTVMGHVLATGEPFLDLHFVGEQPTDPGTKHVWSCSYYRLQDPDGRVLGVCEDSFDITDRYQAQRRLNLLVEAGRRIGTTLDMVGTAREVTAVAVPDFAATVTVDLLRSVLEGGDPEPGEAGMPELVRVAARSRDDPPDRPPLPPYPVAYQRGTLPYRSLSSGGLIRTERAIVVPLRAGGTLMGLVTFDRGDSSSVFDGGEIDLADELVIRAAVSIDNARRFAREHAAALTLQRNLLPQRLPPQSAVDMAYRYLPSDDRAGVGGDWFDVIGLSGTRVGLVVGDVVGHGLQAAATMGRLRTTVRALARMDLAPDELLSRLDDLVGQTPEERAAGAVVEPAPDDVATGVTCLYAVYDPVSRHCTTARAGHPPPVLVAPGGEVSFPDLPAGPPLGLGGLPFESWETELPAGSLLALFTDGLLRGRDRDVDTGLALLGEVLRENHRPLEELCDRAVAQLLPSGAAPDDAALLLVRTRELDARQVAAWELPAEPAAVSTARELATRQLAEWGLAELSYATELAVSELVTNAVRHASGPVHLRLLRDLALVTEVSDTGHTSPHLRYAASDDEGGRGLFIVAQLVQRWGTRYTPFGKTIWTEQAFPPHYPGAPRPVG